ncbi:MAG: hypothetical protein R6U22_02230 [Desulfohalobiaceae bacterium]
MQLRTCVTPWGKFRYKVHQPSFKVHNLRQKDELLVLGRLPDKSPVHNQANFPQGEIPVNQASTVYEIPNALPFRGSTFIDSSWADAKAQDPGSIRIRPPSEVSLRKSLQPWIDQQGPSPDSELELYKFLPMPVLLALATTSTDPQELTLLARVACEFSQLPEGDNPGELAYAQDSQGRSKAVIQDKDLFEAVGNNPYLPDAYKEAMLLRPGAQGPSEVVGDCLDQEQGSHVFEYLRRNSYIPWGHYAANMAQDCVRYRVKELTWADMQGLRHLYYQRSFVRLAAELGLELPARAMSSQELEELRQDLLQSISSQEVDLDCALWGWNFGFDFSPTRYKLHGSHQQVHQQFALIPAGAEVMENGQVLEEQGRSFASGDMVAETVQEYQQQTGQDFFQDLISCIRSNRRTDGGTGEQSLIVYEDQEVLLFVPKAQVSQWELQLLPLRPVGNILEADSACRASLDKAMLIALRILEGLGARMVTSIEFSKRFTEPKPAQRLLYCFLPKLPWSGGSFSEAQHRFISGHFPEDFAAACRTQLQQALQDL